MRHFVLCGLFGILLASNFVFAESILDFSCDLAIPSYLADDGVRYRIENEIVKKLSDKGYFPLKYDQYKEDVPEGLILFWSIRCESNTAESCKARAYLGRGIKSFLPEYEASNLDIEAVINQLPNCKVLPPIRKQNR